MSEKRLIFTKAVKREMRKLGAETVTGIPQRGDIMIDTVDANAVPVGWSVLTADEDQAVVYRTCTGDETASPIAVLRAASMPPEFLH
jgi:hypothetical protein